jgi:hypothetical protein
MNKEQHIKQMIKKRTDFINERHKELEDNQNIQNTWDIQNYKGVYSSTCGNICITYIYIGSNGIYNGILISNNIQCGI